MASTVRARLVLTMGAILLALAGCGGGTPVADTSSTVAPMPSQAHVSPGAPVAGSAPGAAQFQAVRPSQLAIRVPGAQGAIIAVYQALYGKAPSYAQLQSLTTAANANQAAALASIAANFSGTSDADLTRQVLANMKISSLTVGPPTAASLQTLLTQLFAAYGPGSRAAIILNLGNILSDLEADSLYGPAAVGFNIQTLANRDYAVNPANTVDAALAQPLVFPLVAAYKRNVVANTQRSVLVSGTCTGSGSTVQSGLSATRFNGVAAFSKTLSLSVTFTSCSQSSLAGSSITYFDSNFLPIGAETPGSSYEVLSSNLYIPASVAAGSTGIIGSGTIYADSSKRTLRGTENLSYVVEPDTPDTVIFNLISRTFDTLGNLTATEQIRARIDQNGNYTLVSDDVQFSYSSTTHLLVTYP